MMSLATGEDLGTTNETGPIITEAKQSCASLTIQSVGGGGTLCITYESELPKKSDVLK